MKMHYVSGAFAALLLVTAILLTPVADAAETVEFIKPSNALKSTKVNSYIELSGAQISCEAGSGSGTVSSVKIVKMETKYEKCEAVVGSENKEQSATVTPCNFEFSAEDKLGVVSGCKIEVSTCVVEPTKTGLVNEAVYENIKEGAEPEMSVLGDTESIEYKAGSSCEKLGIKSTKAALSTDIVVQGAAARPARTIRVVGAAAGAEKTYTLANKTPMRFVFVDRRAIECGKFEATETTAFEDRSPRRMQPFTLEECKANIFNPANFVQVNGDGVMKTTNCVLQLGPAAGPILKGRMPGIGGFVEGERACALEGSVTENGMTCTVAFIRARISTGVWFTNFVGPPQLVTVKYSESDFPAYHLGFTSEGCGDALPAQGGAVSVIGEATLSGEGTEILVA
jgi:hypothetical protein